MLINLKTGDKFDLIFHRILLQLNSIALWKYTLIIIIKQVNQTTKPILYYYNNINSIYKNQIDFRKFTKSILNIFLKYKLKGTAEDLK